jgi:phage protein D
VEARRAKIDLIYEGANISADIAPFLIDFIYTDNSHGSDDELSVTLEDREGLWRGPWHPEKGALIRAAITVRGWRGEGEVFTMPCGSFEIDTVECSGPPTQVSLKAVSTAVGSSAKREQKTKAWEDIPLSGVAGEISAQNGLSLSWDSPVDPLYARKDQVEKSDLQFLRELCEEAGLALKVTDGKMVVFDEKDYETRAPGSTIAFGDGRLISYRFSSKAARVYKGARVKYHHPVQDETFDVYVGDEEEEASGETLQINEAVNNEAEAEQLAAKRLHEKNKSETTGSFELMGDLSLVGGVTVGVAGFGAFDGVYFVERATHRVSRSRYATSLELRRGAKEKKAAPGKTPKAAPVIDYDFDVYK